MHVTQYCIRRAWLDKIIGEDRKLNTRWDKHDETNWHENDMDENDIWQERWDTWIEMRWDQFRWDEMSWNAAAAADDDDGGGGGEGGGN